MPGVITKADIPLKFRVGLFSLVFLFCVLFFNYHDVTRELHLNDIASILVVVTIIILTVIIRLVFIFGMKYLFGPEKNNIFLQLQEHIFSHDNLLCSIFVWITFVCCLIVKYEIIVACALKYTVFIISVSALFASFHMLFDYDDPDLASSQNMEKSIGAFWAFGAYKSFYEKILFDIIERMTEFENENDVKFLVKKLVLICPVSNNIIGSLDNKDSEIVKKGNLRPVIDDQGANLGRKLLTTVYCIHNKSTLCIAAEMPSPLSTLWKARKMMDDVILKYHRDCFIYTLKNLLKSYPCIILEYDDLNQTSSETWHDFLLSSLDLRGTISEKVV